MFENFSKDWIALTFYTSDYFYRFGFKDGFLIGEFILSLIGITEENYDDYNFTNYFDQIIDLITDFLKLNKKSIPPMVCEILELYKQRFTANRSFDAYFMIHLLRKFHLPKINPKLEVNEYLSHSPLRAQDGLKESDYSYVVIDITYEMFLEELKHYSTLRDK